uniref:Uncharacterized protein n=1 Tax=Lepeophtheirus salmonis TaxID=72036 RepID=A0A0K2U8J9_LEPSM
MIASQLFHSLQHCWSTYYLFKSRNIHSLIRSFFFVKSTFRGKIKQLIGKCMVIVNDVVGIPYEKSYLLPPLA